MLRSSNSSVDPIESEREEDQIDRDALRFMVLEDGDDELDEEEVAEKLSRLRQIHDNHISRQPDQ